MNANLLNHFQPIENRFGKALEKKDVANLSKMLIKDWTLKDSFLNQLNKYTLFQLLEKNTLIYFNYRKKVTNVTLYNQIAIVTSEGHSSGIYNGKRFNKEQVTMNSYRRFGEDWFMCSSRETKQISVGIGEKIDFHNWLKIYKPKNIAS